MYTDELPVQVGIPEPRFKSPPFLLVAPLVAPPAVIVKAFPAVFAVVWRAIDAVLAAFPSNSKEPQSEMVVEEFWRSFPVVESKRAMALSVAEAGQTTSPVQLTVSKEGAEVAQLD